MKGNKTSSDEEKLRDLFLADPSTKYSQGNLKTEQKQKIVLVYQEIREEQKLQKYESLQ